jgi:sarcosine oxidase, subunit alpha
VSGASGAHRTAAGSYEEIDRSRSFTFTWNGQLVSAFEGDTIVSAIMAGGDDVFSRGLKYRRPRGVLSANFHDPNCLVQVGTEPNVRAAHRLARPGMVVSAQNVYPSLKRDVGAVNQLGRRFLGAGFYYKTFMWPSPLWPTYEKVLARFAPGGTAAPIGTSRGRYDHVHLHPDVVVAGGGPAGLAAAVSAARAGASVLLVEEDHRLGGHLRHGGAAEQEVLARLRAEVSAEPGITVLTDAAVTGRYDQNWLGVLHRSAQGVTERLLKVRAGSLVIAQGLFERPLVFEGNDLPGVMLSSAASRLVTLYGVAPGTRAVVLTANAQGDAAAETLRGAGVTVVDVLDARRGAMIRRALGRGHVRGVELEGGRTLEADLLVTAVGWTASTALVNQSGGRPVWDETAARFLPGGRLDAGVFVTGGLAGDGTLDELVAHGSATGSAAAMSAGGRTPGPVAPLTVDPHPALFLTSTVGFVDFTEDVQSKDMKSAANEGYDSSELAKRFTTAAMGPSQGKYETVNAVAALAEATGRTVGELGPTVWRPPYTPISLGALAGRHHEPTRVSPMQGWHASHGAVPIVAGQWIRPEHYGDAAAEARAVRQAVGLIDVTPLGKLDLRGPDVPKLLNLVYTNTWNKLEVGSVRYGVMCAEDGVVMDDGVTARLGPDRYLMSTTSSGAATVWEWLENWLQTEHPDWRVAITPVTTAFASINVAGPRSRELMERVVTDVDLSNDGFPYMKVREGTIAGVPNCVMWRIGFTGELSYEIHVPAAYGLHVWETLMYVGADLEVAPFGLEAQRILRLEKGHFIVAQDTDALTKAFSAGLDSLIKLEKPDYFAGRSELAWQAEADADDARLVLLQTADPTLVPPEACQIVDARGLIIGRVTSSRMSPTLGRSIALAQIPRSASTPGTSVTIVLPDRTRVQARVHKGQAFFDPEGGRLRA